MNSLHKKIGVVALSSALVMGGAVAGASHMRDLQSKGLVAEAAVKRQKKQEIKVPFLLESELKGASEAQKEKNDKDIVYGLSKIYGYSFYRFYKPDKIENHMIDLGELKNGNEFIKALFNIEIEDNKMYVVKVGNQEYMLQSNAYRSKNFMWWLYLDQWQFDGKAQIDSMIKWS